MAGRKKIYRSEAALRKAVNAYFRKISRTAPVMEMQPTGRYTQKGKPIMEQKQVMNDDGEPMYETQFIRAPSLAALCLDIGVSTSTWSNYGADEKLGDVVEEARMRMEDYWQNQLNTRNAAGARFALSANFGFGGRWKERTEISLDEATRNSMKEAAAEGNNSLAERMALLASMGLHLPQDAEPELDGMEDEVVDDAAAE